MSRNYRIPSDYSRYKLCRKVKKWDNLNLTSPASLAYDKAIVGGQIITDYINGDIEDGEIVDAVCGGLSSEEIGLDETVEKIAQKSGKDLLRYFKSEKSYKRNFEPSRTLMNAPSLEFYIGEELFKWAPGALAISDTTIEAIVYKMGKPKINTRTGIKKDDPSSKADWFPVYCALQYAKAAMNKLVEEGKIADKAYTVAGSFYYMKKTTDKKGAPRDEDFFSDRGGNIVTLSEKHQYGEEEKKSELDDIFIPFIDEHDLGIEECSEDDCKYCSYRATCKHIKTPQRLGKKEVKASSVKPTPTPAQQEVIDEVVSGAYPIVEVIAGAGAGKTFTMKELVRALLLKGVDLAKILVLSFTDAGVKELKERIQQVCVEENIFGDVQAKTFNGFGFEIVKDKYTDAELAKIPDILTAEFEMQYIEDLIAENDVPGADMEAISYGSDGTTTPEILVITRAIFDILAAKRLDVDDPDSLDIVKYELSEKSLYGKTSDTTISFLMKLYAEYQKRYKEDGYLTYADQEPLMMKVLDKNPEYLSKLGYEYIIVDEYQDSNDIQMECINRLADTICFNKLVVVGDDAQAVFGFRETSPEFILNLQKYVNKPVKVMYLLENRRSTPEILDLANKVIAQNVNRVEKDLVATRDHGEKPVVQGFHLKDKEYEWIADEMEKRISEGTPWEQIAFIAGTKAELVAMGKVLSERNIPWVMKNPMNLLENSKVQAALALSDAFYDPETTENYFTYLSARYDGKLMEKPLDEVTSLIDVLKNVFLGIENEEMDTQKQIFHSYLEQLRVEGEEDELYEYFLELLYKNPDLPSELRYTRIFKKYGAKMAKKMDQNYVGVVLTTAHSSKGLEWDVVFNSITAYDALKFHRSPIRRQSEIEEKRRLLFVSITRARDVLYITGQFRVSKSTDAEPVYNSFLKEVYDILETDYDPIDHDKEKRQAEAKERAKAKAKERREKQKAEKAASSASRPMTEEEKEAYDKMVQGACQTSLF